MDLFDRAQELELRQREAAIKAAASSTPTLRYTGVCAYCEAPLPSPRRFCDGECREGWEREMAAIERNGRGVDLSEDT